MCVGYTGCVCQGDFILKYFHRVKGWKEWPPSRQNISLQCKHWAERKREKKGGRARMRRSCQCVKGGDLEREQRGDREIGAHGKGLVCQPGEAWDHCPVLLCAIILLNPALLLSASPPPASIHTLTHSSDCSVYWWLKLAVSFRIHSQHWSSCTSGPNGLISTVYSCALSRMTHKGTKRPLCTRELFLFSSTGPADAHCTFLRKPSCPSSFDKLAVFSRASLSSRPLSCTVPVFHPLLYRRIFTLSSVNTSTHRTSYTPPSPFMYLILHFFYTLFPILFYSSSNGPKIQYSSQTCTSLPF